MYRGILASLCGTGFQPVLGVSGFQPDAYNPALKKDHRGCGTDEDVGATQTGFPVTSDFVPANAAPATA